MTDETEIMRPEGLERPRVEALDRILGQAFKVLDDGFVRVVDYMGSDESIVQAARVSYGKRDQEDARGPRADPLPHAAPAHDAVRDVRDQAPRPRADGLLAPVDSPPHRERERVLDALLGGDRRGAVDAARTNGAGRRRATGRAAASILEEKVGETPVRTGSRAAADGAQIYEERRRTSASRASRRARTCRCRPTPRRTGRSTSTTSCISSRCAWTPHAQLEIRRLRDADRRRNRRRAGCPLPGRRSSTTGCTRSC